MKNNSSNNMGLTQAEIGKLWDLLLEKSNKILGNVFSIEDKTLHRQRSDLSNMPIHMSGIDNYETEHTLGLVDSERKFMRETDETLTRIESSTQGTCEGTDNTHVELPWKISNTI